MNNAMMRNMMAENNIKEEPKVEEEVKTEKTNEDSLTLAMCCLPMLLSLMTDSNKNDFDTKILHEKIHDLDKRLAVCEALIKDKK